MRVDIFKREEANGIYSYLLIPAGKNIPGEATNTDWMRKKWTLTSMRKVLTISPSFIRPYKSGTRAMPSVTCRACRID